MKFILFFTCYNAVRFIDALNTKRFPEDFLFGAATSAYQVEGAWNLNGKGPNVWDQFTHSNPDKIADGSSGDVACDSYHKIKEDVSLLKELGVQFYRFSISWSRLLPRGHSYLVNPDGVRYYNELIDELVTNGIKPMITLYHWDLPVDLQNMGGWTNPLLVDVFGDYARFAFETFGNRVPYWVTFNTECQAGYGSDYFPPNINQSGFAEYLCVHVILKAHAKVYRLYDEEFRSKQKGNVGIVAIDVNWYEPKTDTKEDVEAAERARQFSIGWVANPLLHKDGDYPQIMKERIAFRSNGEGHDKSRLPTFSGEEVNFIKGACDFIGVNIYTSKLVGDVPEDPFDLASFDKDVRVSMAYDPEWPSTNLKWLKVAPNSMRSVLKWIKDQYDNPPVIITENGYADDGRLNDYGRINFLQLYLSSLLDAIHEDNVNVVAYTAWSLMDNFEWIEGYTQKFGLYHVDFDDDTRPRTAKSSAKFYKDVVANRKIANRYVKEEL